MPVRKITKNYRSLTGQVVSLRQGVQLPFESSLERDFILLFDFDTRVDHIEEQPVSISYSLRPGKISTYTPDFLVNYRQDIAASEGVPPCLYEVKFREDLFAHWEHLKPKFNAAKKYSYARGWNFKIITEAEIRTPFLENIRFLKPYLRNLMHTDDENALLDSLETVPVSTPEQLLSTCTKSRLESAKLIPALWRLVAEKRIGADLSKPLTMNTRIWSRGF